MRASKTPVSLLCVGLAVTTVACGADPFPSDSIVTGLRVLGMQTQPVYGRPDGTVDLNLLVWDGKADPASPRPIEFAWLGRPPFACYNPPGDRYYGCFQQMALGFGAAGASDGGSSTTGEPTAEGGEEGASGIDSGALAGGSGSAGDDAGSLTQKEPPGLGSFTPEAMNGPILPPDPLLRYSIPIPSQSEIITRTREATGVTPYGTAYVFFALCAGHLSVDPTAIGSSVFPASCRGENQEPLGSEDFLTGYASVYVYDELTNNNPIVSGFLFDGKPVSPLARTDPAYVPHVPRCTKSKQDDCPTRDLRPIIDPSSAEIDPDANADHEMREQMWVSYYATKGSFQSTSKLVNDATKGWNEKHGTSWHLPLEAGPARIWAVVHDSRGGVAWSEADVIVDP